MGCNGAVLDAGSVPSKVHNRPIAQWNLVPAHLQQSKFNTVYTHRTALLMLGTLHSMCASTVAQLHALSTLQN